MSWILGHDQKKGMPDQLFFIGSFRAGWKQQIALAHGHMGRNRMERMKSNELWLISKGNVQALIWAHESLLNSAFPGPLWL